MSKKNYKFELKSQETNCTGVIVRGKTHAYYSKGTFMYHFSFYVLKRKSCKCDTCAIMLDGLETYFSDDPEFAISNPEIIENKKLYEIIYVEDGRDWETGTEIDYHYELKEYTEPKKEN